MKSRHPGTTTEEASEPGLSIPAAHDGEDNAARAYALLTPLVGIGASSGGLEALQEFCAELPGDAAFSCVVLTHQHPGSSSMLPELLGRSTKWPVARLENGVRPAAGTLYVTPPGFVPQLEKGALMLYPDPGDRRPIDAFFRSLAQELGDAAIALILSGTGTDGTRGAADVKTAGGLVLSQERSSAKFSGMPASAVAAGAVELELRPGEMPAEIARHLSLRLEEAQEPRREAVTRALKKILNAMRTRTGHDFSGYKKSTLLRRIDRRMSVRGVSGIRDYARYVNEVPSELDLLFKGVLIGVTSFFRDEECFECFTSELRRVLAEHGDDERPLRVWVSACATGEEAYSVAILLKELMTELGCSPPVQVFATDLDVQAIEMARAGRYPHSIAEHVSPERLERFFVKRDSDYRISREIREMVVFAVQNVIKDPPFTKLDVLTCRNLLIYLEPELQRRVLGLFTHALNPGGVLLLGSSETLGRLDDAFESLERKHKVFRRRPVAHGSVPEFPGMPPTAEGRAPPERVPLMTGSSVPHAVERVLLTHLAPSSVLVNQSGDIAYFHGRTGQFLEPPTGEPASNLFSMAREGLRLELPAALRQAAASKDPVVRPGLQVKSDGGFIAVRLTVRRIDAPDALRGSFIVSFEVEPPPAARSKKDRRPLGATEERLAELELDLQHTRENLQGTIEELETSNEELKSTNEELQSTNEELQSANEELETSREEMQSLNEELQSVNAELEERNRALSQANDDMQNLLNSTDIATVFLDAKLAIKRFTTPAREVFQLIDTDIGRPISDLTANLRYDGLVEDAREVLESLVFSEREIQTKEGAWRRMRIMPHRTADNAIDALVITFVDIDRIRREERAADEARVFGDEIVDALPNGVAVLDADLRVLRANRSFLSIFDTSSRRIVGELVSEGIEARLPGLRARLEHVLSTGQAIEREPIDGDAARGGSDTMRFSARRFAAARTDSKGIVLVVEHPDSMPAAT